MDLYGSNVRTPRSPRAIRYDIRRFFEAIAGAGQDRGVSVGPVSTPAEICGVVFSCGILLLLHRGTVRSCFCNRCGPDVRAFLQSKRHEHASNDPLAMSVED